MQKNIRHVYGGKRRWHRYPATRILPLLMLMLACCLPAVCLAGPDDDNNTLILYYSRTGKSKIVADTLHEHLNADLLEINENKDRSGALGFMGAALDSFLDRETDIIPSAIDLDDYDNVIMVSPIWNWNIAVPIRTCISHADLRGKKLLMFTTANIDIKKYEVYGDDAPFVKRFLRDYLRSKSAAMRERTRHTGADMRGHFHIETQNVSDQHIREATLRYVRQAAAALAGSAENPL